MSSDLHVDRCEAPLESTSRARDRPTSGSTTGRRLVAPLGRVVRELDVLIVGPWRRDRRRALAIDIGVVGCLLIWAASWLQAAHPQLLSPICNENAGLAWPLAILRMPGSMFAPAPRLPIWGALAQVLCCFGLAEAHLGRRVTLVVLAGCHVAATVSARAFVWIGPHSPLHLGVPHWVRHQTDTGPSAAVVGLGTYLGVLLKLPILTTALVGAMLVETALRPDLADREHLVAIAVGGLAGVAVRLRQVAGEVTSTPIRSTVS